MGLKSRKVWNRRTIAVNSSFEESGLRMTNSETGQKETAQIQLIIRTI
jgi:hypothetical protein